MKVMVATWAAPTHYFPMVPLARALRLAGHDVRVVTQPALVPAVRASGLPAAATRVDLSVPELVAGLSSRREAPGRSVAEPAVRGVIDLEPYVRVAEVTAPQTLEYAEKWRPDLVVYEPSTYAGPLAAARLGVPAVRHLWGVDYLQRFRKVEPYVVAGLCASLDLPAVDMNGDLTVDPCPHSLQVPDDPDEAPVNRLRTRYLPYNGPAVLPPWLTAPPERPRICVTWGTTGVSRGPYLDTVRAVIAGVAGLDVEVVATLSAADAAQLDDVPANVRVVSMLALNLLLPSCSAIVAQGGLGTMMTAAALGVPALIVPQTADHVLNAAQLSAVGAGHVLPFDQASAPAVREAVGRLLESREPTEAAQALAAEMAGQTSPADAVKVLERLAAEGPASVASSTPGPASGTSSGTPARTSAPGAPSSSPSPSSTGPASTVRATRTRPPSRSRPPRRTAPRVLVTPPRWSTGTGTAMISFARALRVAGFDVLLALSPEYDGPAARCGLQTVSVGRAAQPAEVQRMVFSTRGVAKSVEVQAKEGMTGLISLRARMELPEEERGEWVERWRGAYVQGIRAALDAAPEAVEDTVALARAWRPDLVLFGPNNYAGPLAAAVVGAATVRHLSWADQSAVLGVFEQEALTPLWDRYGAGEPDVLGDLTLDPCPLALSLYAEPAAASSRSGGSAGSASGSGRQASRRRPLAARSRMPIRYTPYVAGVDEVARAAAADAHVAAGADADTTEPRPRVCVAIGSGEGWPEGPARTVATVVDALAGLDADVVVAASPRDRAELGALPDNARLVDEHQLNSVLAQCPALVTAGEPDALLSAVSSVSPTLVLPQLPEQAIRAHRFARSGGGLTLTPAAADAGAIRTAVDMLLKDQSFRVPLRRMRDEMLGKPGYGDVVATISEAL